MNIQHHQYYLCSNSLNAVKPRDELISTTSWCMALHVRLRGTVNRIEHHQAVLGPSILQRSEEGETD